MNGTKIIYDMNSCGPVANHKLDLICENDETCELMHPGMSFSSWRGSLPKCRRGFSIFAKRLLIFDYGKAKALIGDMK